MSGAVRKAEYSEDTAGRVSHFHDVHQMIYVTEGTAAAEVEGKKYDLVPGSILVVSRFEKHSVTPHGEVYRRITVQIYPDAILSEGDTELFSLFSDRPEGFSHLISPKDEAGEIRELFYGILSESGNKLPYGNDMAEMYLRGVMIRLFRILPGLFTRDEGDGAQTVRAVQRKLEKDYRLDISVTSLAEEYHISVSYLSHLFKKLTGFSVMGYLLACRLAAAKKMLSHTSLPISRVVDSCGFGDQSKFSRVFRKNTGMTPTEFRKLNK